jgi:hypothetical protein
MCSAGGVISLSMEKSRSGLRMIKKLGFEDGTMDMHANIQSGRESRLGSLDLKDRVVCLHFISGRPVAPHFLQTPLSQELQVRHDENIRGGGASLPYCSTPRGARGGCMGADALCGRGEGHPTPREVIVCERHG